MIPDIVMGIFALAVVTGLAVGAIIINLFDKKDRKNDESE